MRTPPATEELRHRIRSELPEDTFERQPWRALWFVPLTALGIAGIVTIITVRPAWIWALLIGLVVGHCIATLGFLAHETLHGSLVSSARLQTFLGYVGFAPMLVSPTLWRTWHNQVHHGKTNRSNADPDGFGTLSRFEKAPSTRFVADSRPAPPPAQLPVPHVLVHVPRPGRAVAPGAPDAFVRPDGPSACTHRQPRRAGGVGGGRRARRPVAGASSPWSSRSPVANVIVMGYIATNHFLRPSPGRTIPVENSMSVTTPEVIDRLHSASATTSSTTCSRR